MACALGMLALTYAALWFGVVELFRSFPGAWPYWVIVALALGAGLIGHYAGADKTLLKAAGATLLEQGTEPKLQAMTQRIASLADIPMPRLALIDTEAANAFAVGLGHRRAVIVLTEGLRRTLTEPELEAVVAHEISHIANRDAAVLTAVAVPRILGELIVGGPGSSLLGLVWLSIWPLGIPLVAVGSLLTLTVSRYREFSADRGSAILTGAPEQLMSALSKLASRSAAIPHRDLREANAFCIVSTHASRMALFSDHPPLERRLAALAKLARDLGRATSR